MLVDLNVIEAKIIYHGEVTECALAVNEGKIYKIGKLVNLPRASENLDVRGKLVIPGCVDVHVHLRDMELAHKEDFRSGTCAAATGGFTTVLDMPNTQPPTNSPERLEEKMSRSERRILVNVGFYGAFPSRWEDFDKMIKAGVVAFKLNLQEVITELDVEDDRVLLKAFQKASALDRPVVVHAEDRRMVYKLKAKLQKAGDVSIAAYLKAHSPEAEVQALERVLSLAEKARVRLHVAHVTADRSLELIKKAKKGLSLTCEVSPHHLLLTEGKLDLMGNIALTDPPLRALSHVKRLWRGVEEGIIDIIASDHAPHLLTEKEGKDPWEAPPGIPGLETALPLMLTQVKRGRISLHRLISMLSERPVQIFGLKGKGRLAAGFDADLTVIDLKKEGVVSPPNFCSKAKYSPFEGYRTVGKAVKTLVKGELVMDEGEVVGSPGTGEVLRIS